METKLPKAVFPLCWPAGRPRATVRRDARFQADFADSYNGLLTQLNRFNATNVVVSSFVPIKPIDGLDMPSLTIKAHKGIDPAVAVSFRRNGADYAIGCDTYNEVRWNLRALEVALKAFRDLERHGSTELCAQALGGFLALPAGNKFYAAPGTPEYCDECGGTRYPKEEHEEHCSLYGQGDPIAALEERAPSSLGISKWTSEPWRAALALFDDATLKDAERSYRALAKANHPDKGGDAQVMITLGKAIRAAREHFRQVVAA